MEPATMYKTAAERLHSLARAGSHATKPFSSGRIDALPPSARPIEELYQSVKTQLFSLIDQWRMFTEEAKWINDRLKFTVPYEEYKRLNERRELLASHTQATQAAISEFKLLARAIGRDAFGAVYMEVAYKMLPREYERPIFEETASLMGRTAVELRAGRAELSEGRRQALRDRENRRDKRQRYESTKERLAAAKRGGFVGHFPSYIDPQAPEGGDG
jgi:hypothetical protein